MMKLILGAVVLASLAPQSFARGNREMIFIDPGHTKDAPGVIGTCGTQEVWVNDQLALRVARLLQERNYRVNFSRDLIADKSEISQEAGRESTASLTGRGERANRARAAIMVSIHHDSMIETGLVQNDAACAELTHEDKRVVSDEFLAANKLKVGFNVFVQTGGPRFARSLDLAKAIGREFLGAGQIAANFHTPEIEPQSCGSCKFEDEELGVMSRRLGAISRATMPAVLVEVTNLRVLQMEKDANDPEYREMIAIAIVNGIEKYFGR